MNTSPIDDLHQKAMELADEAFYAKRKEELRDVWQEVMGFFREAA